MIQIFVDGIVFFVAALIWPDKVAQWPMRRSWSRRIFWAPVESLALLLVFVLVGSAMGPDGIVGAALNLFLLVFDPTVLFCYLAFTSIVLCLVWQGPMGLIKAGLGYGFASFAGASGLIGAAVNKPDHVYAWANSSSAILTAFVCILFVTAMYSRLWQHNRA